MRTNMSSLDRIIRAVVGVVLIFLSYAALTGALAVTAYVVAGVMLLTAAVGYCPLYTLLHTSTGGHTGAGR